MYGFPYFIRNQWFKDIFIRSKERKEINEKYVLISLFYEESNISGFVHRLKEVEEIKESYPNIRVMCYLFEILHFDTLLH